MSEICDEILKLADDELHRVANTLPEDATHSIAIFIETLRAYDYNCIVASTNDRIEFPDFYLIRMGWSLCSSYLFKKTDIQGIPVMESTKETRVDALYLLQNFGRIIMLRRAVDMVESGLLLVEKMEDTYVFKKTDLVDMQFIDKLSFPKLVELEKKISSVSFYNNWNIASPEDLLDVPNIRRNFVGLNKKNEFKNYLIEDIDSKMLPLIFPWNSGHGVMMGYNTTEEIDYHFLSKAHPLVLSWRTDAGIHPSTDFIKFDGGELTAIVLLITSLYLKHGQFAPLAAKKHPEISIPQSLTIWQPFEELKNIISDFTGMDISKISDILNAMTLKINDIMFLRNNTSIFMPLLIDMGNGYVVQPISSILTNPFQSIINLMEYRNPQIRHSISKPREDWMRTEIYSLFLGERYIRIEGNINLKDKGKIVTDIDGAIYDKMNGELAIIQIKWQDFFINDVRKLRSKAHNLCKGFDEWATRVEKWIKANGLQELSKNLRLGKGNTIKSLYLFGISRTVSQTGGYGYSTERQNIAISNMPMFVKSRFEIGPVDNVIQKLFNELKTTSQIIETIPYPFEFRISNFNFHFEDLHCTLKD